MALAWFACAFGISTLSAAPEFRGVLRTSRGIAFALVETVDGESKWVEIGGSFLDHKITAFDSALEQLTLRKGDEFLTLSLIEKGPSTLVGGGDSGTSKNAPSLLSKRRDRRMHLVGSELKRTLEAEDDLRRLEAALANEPNDEQLRMSRNAAAKLYARLAESADSYLIDLDTKPIDVNTSQPKRN